MLGKLLKYDLKKLFKLTLPLFGISFLLGFIIFFLTKFLFDIFFVLDFAFAMVVGLSFAVICFMPIIIFVVCMYQYYKSMVKDEGYLTHTLPVKKSSLILSKLISTLIINVLSVIVLYLSLYIACHFNSWFFDVINDIIEYINEWDSFLLIIWPILFITSYVLNILIIYTAISFGQKHDNKLLFSIIYSLVLYWINQFILSVLILIPAIFSEYYFEQMENDMPEALFMNIFMIIMTVIYVAMDFGYFAISKHNLEKKLNLE